MISCEAAGLAVYWVTVLDVNYPVLILTESTQYSLSPSISPVVLPCSRQTEERREEGVLCSSNIPHQSDPPGIFSNWLAARVVAAVQLSGAKCHQHHSHGWISVSLGCSNVFSVWLFWSPGPHIQQLPTEPLWASRINKYLPAGK